MQFLGRCDKAPELAELEYQAGNLPSVAVVLLRARVFSVACGTAVCDSLPSPLPDAPLARDAVLLCATNRKQDGRQRSMHNLH
jgi:hypothetical protein